MSGSPTPRVLLLGYGNPGRLDDGLGQALVERIAPLGIPGVTADLDYQLQIEHAAQAAEHDVVVFADAAAAGPEPFSFRRIQAVDDVGFTTHALPPAGVLGIARDHLGVDVEGWMLGIRGYEFNEFGEGLSERAEANLTAAVEFLDPLLRTRRFDEIAAGTGADTSRVPASVKGS